MNRGYTLLELVVVVGVLGFLSIAAVGLFLSSIKGGGKVEVKTVVKQNGQFALNTMVQFARQSRQVVGCSPVPNTRVELLLKSGDRVTFSCEDVGTATGYLASASSALVSRMTSAEVTVDSCSFICVADEQGLRGPRVGIDFSLSQSDPSAKVTESATVDFSTGVYLRGY
jgi:prepilin-type N-terminal cleavage/methylation domain-containing protein